MLLAARRRGGGGTVDSLHKCPDVGPIPLKRVLLLIRVYVLITRTGESGNSKRNTCWLVFFCGYLQTALLMKASAERFIRLRMTKCTPLCKTYACSYST